MPTPPATWVLLVYKIPAQPTRLRLLIWRRLQSMGVVYLQDAVCLLPARDDLVENMHYVSTTIEEMGGTCHLFLATALLPGGAARLVDTLRAQADQRHAEIMERVSKLQTDFEQASEPAAIERIGAELKRERAAYLRARRLDYCGSTLQDKVEARLDDLRRLLDSSDPCPNRPCR